MTQTGIPAQQKAPTDRLEMTPEGDEYPTSASLTNIIDRLVNDHQLERRLAAEIVNTVAIQVERPLLRVVWETRSEVEVLKTQVKDLNDALTKAEQAAT